MVSSTGSSLDLAAQVLEIARLQGIKIATAESCTGGLLAATLTEIPGSSTVFERGFVTYSNESKTEMLGVPTALIAKHGAVSEEVAAAMASGALSNSQAQLSVSITGIAGPGGSEFKPEGRVCFGLSTGKTETIEFGAQGRTEVREAATVHALALLSEYLHKFHS